MTKTLFLKDSVLFISIDGKEYEVLEQDIRLSLDGDRGSIPAKRVIENLGRIEWPGGVELITIAPHPECNKARECLQLTDGLNCSQAYDARIRDTSLCAKAYKIARLLSKEKKEPESEYKQFESTGPIDDSLNDNLPKFESSEPQRCPDCGYSLEDAQFNMDHHLCKNKDFFRNSGPQEKKPDSFYGYLEEGVYGEFRHVPEPSPNKNKIGFIFGSKRYEFTRCASPVESQEEMCNEIIKIVCRHALKLNSDSDAIKEITGKFSITRLTH